MSPEPCKYGGSRAKQGGVLSSDDNSSISIALYKLGSCGEYRVVGYRDFVNRKGWTSYILQAVVDDNLFRVLAISLLVQQAATATYLHMRSNRTPAITRVWSLHVLGNRCISQKPTCANRVSHTPITAINGLL